MYQTHHPQPNLRFALASVVVLAVACILRLQPWHTNPSQVAQPAASAAAAAVSLPPDLAPAVLDFYDKVDRGQYGEAYDLSLETRWARQPDGSYQPAGLVSRQEFVDALTSEFGANGTFIHIDAIQILNIVPLPMSGALGTDAPESAILVHLPAGLELTGLYQVNMAGSVGDSCTPAPWHKRLVVAGSDDGHFRVLLPGGPRPGSTHKIEWFSDKDPFVWSQGQQEEAN